MSLVRVVCLLLFVGITSGVVAQKTGTVRGVIYTKKTGEPAMFINVKVKGTTLGGTSDVNGLFSIPKVPVGKQVLTISAVGFKELTKEVEIKANRITSVKLKVEEGVTEIEGVEISAEAIENKTEVKMSVTKVSSKEIKQIPTIGGEADIATYFETVPGVVSTGDQGGQLYVRGGSPIQNKILLDGMTIYNPFHSIGFFSVFDTDVIRNAEIYTGGFSAEYGQRISSIMDITTIDGNKNRLAGRVSSSPFATKLMVNGPLLKQNADGGGKSITYVLSAKHSYLDRTSKVLYDYVDTNGLPFNFTDLYGKVSVNGESGSKFNLFGFRFTDRVRYKALSDYNWSTFGAGSNFVIVPGSSPVFITGKFSYSKYTIELAQIFDDELIQDQKRSSSVDAFDFGFDFKYLLGDNAVRFGFEVDGPTTEYTAFNTLGNRIELNNNNTNFGAYINLKYIIGRLILNPGFRYQYYNGIKLRQGGFLSNNSPEPRLGLKFNATEKLRIKAAGGLYSQNLMSANSDRDVVNLFYGFVSSASNVPKKFTEQDLEQRDVTHALQRSTHAILGFEYDFTSKLSLNVEGYYKWFNQLTNLNRTKIYEDNGENTDKPDALKKDFNLETGHAKGVDFVVKYDDKRINMFAVYSLGYVDRWDGTQLYNPIFDRRHNVNLIASYKLGEKKDWEVNFRWNFGSGLPFTQTQGFYHSVDFNEEGIGTAVEQENANDLSVLYGELNRGRMPAYHRLDLTVKKGFRFDNSSSKFMKNSKMEIVAGVTNAYSRRNIFYVERVTNEIVYQLPILPSVGISWSF